MSFLATCLGTPEVFESNSLSSVDDFITILCDDASPLLQSLFRELMDELERQVVIEKVSE